MTATSSRNGLPMRYALRMIHQNRKMTIVSCILYLLGIPVAMTAALVEMISDTRVTDAYFHSFHGEVYVVLGCGCLGAAVFLGMFGAINAFIELHKKTKVDMLYTLPLTGTQRFFANYIGGFLTYAIPYLVSVVIGWILFFALSPFINWSSTNSPFDSHGEFITTLGKYYLLGSLGLLVLMLLYYTLSTFVTVCCGTLFESIYTNFLLNCLIPGTVALVAAVLSNELYFDFEYHWQIVGFMSPIGGLFYLIMLLSGDLNHNSSYEYGFSATQTHMHDMLPSYLRWFFVILLLSAALLVLAWQLYIRRKAEHVGKPFIYTAIYHVMLTLITVAILCLMEADVFGPALLFSAIVYFVMEVIRKRGFKKFWKSLITYAATVAVSLGAFFLITLTGCFGRVNYVPAAAGVRSVELDFDPSYRSYSSMEFDLEYTDRDIISAICSMHRDLVKVRDKNGAVDDMDAFQLQMAEERYIGLTFDGSYEQGFTADYPIFLDDGGIQIRQDFLDDPSQPLPEGTRASYAAQSSFSITYYTLAGTVIHRSYDLYPDEVQQLLSIVQGTELYGEAAKNGVSRQLTSRYSTYQTGAGYVLPNRVVLSMTAFNETSYNDGYHQVTLYHASEQIPALAEAYGRDIAKMSAEDFCTADIWGWLNSIPVYDCCTESIEMLEEWGFRPFTPAEYAGFINANSAAPAMGIRLYRPEDSTCVSKQYPHSTLGNAYYRNNAAQFYTVVLPYGIEDERLEENYPELYAVLKEAKRNCIDSGENYSLFINNNYYVVPASAADKCEALIASKTNGSSEAVYYDASGNPVYAFGNNETTLNEYYYDEFGNVIDSYDVPVSSSYIE